MLGVKGPIDSISLKLAFLEHYETYYGIYDHEGHHHTVSVLAPILMHQKENYEPYGRYIRLATNFDLYDIKTLFGYNLTEFLNLTRNEIDMLFEVAAQKKLRRESLEDKTLKELSRVKETGHKHDA